MRNVNRKQKPLYVGGSSAKGWYEYSVQGTERCGPRLSYYDFIGRGATRQAAIQRAWDEAKSWEYAIADRIIADLEEDKEEKKHEKSPGEC